MKWIGTDESGKGDYFGGLAVAGVMVDESTASKLRKLGVKDSKKLSDSRVGVLSTSIKEICPHSVVSIGPEKYNELYSKLRNLNRLLAWAHARVIENLLESVRCELVIADKFGDERYIEKALMEKGKQIRLEQRKKAESDPAVAGASILARDMFLEELKNTGEQIGTVLPKGAGPQVEVVARDLVKKYGEDVLEKIAKVHFKTTCKIKEILHGVYPERDSSVASLSQNDKERRGQNDKEEKSNNSEGVYPPQLNVPQPFMVELKDKSLSSKVSLEKIWAPWRVEYIYSLPAEECIFCSVAKSDLPRRRMWQEHRQPKTEHRPSNTDFVLYRGEKAFVMMNIFPYNNGHLMVAPYRHIANVEELMQEEVDSLFKLVQKSVKVLKAKMRPQGFNIGMNLGKVAGAGVEGHLHIHIVPRWNGDTNFMPVVSGTKVISQSLQETYKLLREGFE